MERLKYLFEQYIHKTATPAERLELQDMLQNNLYDAQVKQLIDQYFVDFEVQEQLLQLSYSDKILASIFAEADQQQIVKKTPLIKRFRRDLAIAASIIVLICAGILFFNTSRQPGHGRQTDFSSASPKIVPGSNTAILTLSNGKTVQLSDAKTGVVIDASKLKYSDGTAIASSFGEEMTQSASPSNVEVKTPRGGTYQVILSDGSKVWLNAASSIQFPASFKGVKQRNIKLTGEAYFEVFKDRSRPFIVESEGQLVEVLGTHFNINSYGDEGNTKTTLLEGSVKINNETLLSPGQQAISVNGKTSIVEADTKMEIAWINGKFVFNSTRFESAMSMISRWYDVEVVYDYKPATLNLGGSISRSRSLTDVLNRIEQTDEVKFKIEGRRIRVIR